MNSKKKDSNTVRSPFTCRGTGRGSRSVVCAFCVFPYPLIESHEAPDSAVELLQKISNSGICGSIFSYRVSPGEWSERGGAGAGGPQRVTAGSGF